MKALIYWWKERLWNDPIKAWNWFWFDSRSNNDLWSLGLFRLFFGLTMLFFYFTRAFDVSDFYTESGLLPSAYAKAMDISKFHESIFFYVKSAQAMHIFHSLFLVCLFLLAIGFFTRFFSIVVYLLQISFLFRNPTVMFGVDMISTLFFLYLPFTNAGARLSVDAWLRKKKNKSDVVQGGFSHIFFRLMQVQLCIVYAYAGLEKLKGTRWWDGSAIWDVFSIGTMQRWDFSFVAHIPVVIAIATYVVLFWEIFFPVLVWDKRWRPYFLAFGIALHVGIAIFMNLPSFGAMMISVYALFWNGETIERIVRERRLEAAFR